MAKEQQHVKGIGVSSHMAKVFLGVGHGGKDPGAIGYLVEKDVNLQMALACKIYLEAHGIQVKLSRYQDENDELSEVIQECNAYKPDLCVDVHNNAGGGDGFEVFYRNKDKSSLLLAQNIEREVKAIGQNSRGCKVKLTSGGTDYFGFLRLTKCPAVLCEGVFVDNKDDAAQADTLEEQKAFGVAYAKGILKTLGKVPSSSVVAKNAYTVKVTAVALNVRREPDITSPVVTVIKQNDVYTIVDEKNGWGKLKSGAGWISLAYTTHSPYYTCLYKGLSIVDALESIGVDSSFATRQKIAAKNNMYDYMGLAKQNELLLSKLKAGTLLKL